MKDFATRWLLLLSAVALGIAAAGAGQIDPEAYRQSIENDWLLQAELQVEILPVSAKDDAAGACDGIKNGQWGFHTDREQGPWWQVDLGCVHSLDHVLVYNRTDVPMRAARVMLLLSEDGKAWRKVYEHDGTAFLGATDKRPLRINLDGARARFVRLQLPTADFFHLDEVEVFGTGDSTKNLALGQPADQSSISRWSARTPGVLEGSKEGLRRIGAQMVIPKIVDRGRRLIVDLAEMGVDVSSDAAEFEGLARRVEALGGKHPSQHHVDLYLELRRVLRKLVLSNPLLGFDDILLVKRVPGSFSHMSDQYLGWWSRPGGGVFMLEDFKSDSPRLRCLTEGMPEGSFLRPDLSFDGRRVLFAYCRHYPGVSLVPNKLAKEALPEDSFYSVYETGLDGSGLRRLTRGRYNDFDARYLPDGGVVFLSTRRGQSFQCGAASAQRTTTETLPEGYVRCGGGPQRPCAVYTLHTMRADGSALRAISAFEMFEWTPSVASDGRILYSRWDYVDRDNMPYMSLWSTNPDGTNPRLVYGNFTHSPHCTFEPRSVPGSDKIIFTASGHHSITGGSLVLLDPKRGTEGADPVKRLTPEVCFPEIEGWPRTYYVNPWPLGERYYLVAWSNVPIVGQSRANPANALGVYVYDAFGNLELIYRDPDISCTCPIPARPRPRPPAVASNIDVAGAGEGRLLLQRVGVGLSNVRPGRIKRVRVVGIPIKTHPTMNRPRMGLTRDDPGKCVLGTAPVEADGSAYFRVPSGVSVFFQALDEEGCALQTMRTATYVQPGQTLSCIGCHEHRLTAPAGVRPVAAGREPSRLTVGPEGSWPLRYDRLVQPVLDEHCVRCHRPGSGKEAASKFDLTCAKSYDNLTTWGSPSLCDAIVGAYRQGRSTVGLSPARSTRLLAHLRGGHKDVRLSAGDYERLITWMDTYAQLRGSFSAEQEERLIDLRRQWADMLIDRHKPDHRSAEFKAGQRCQDRGRN